MAAWADGSGPMSCEQGLEQVDVDDLADRRCGTAASVAKAAARAVTSSVRAIGGSSGPPSGSPLIAAKPDMASAHGGEAGAVAVGAVLAEAR